jgi:hypothetical protein
MKLIAGPLEKIAAVDVRVTNVCVSQEGRVICGFPRWQDDFSHPPVAEVVVGAVPSSLLPQHWGQWHPGKAGDDHLVSIHALHLDRFDHLWILDDGCPKLGQPVSGGPKVVQFDLADDRIVRTYSLEAPATHDRSILSHMRTDASHIYVTDAGSGAILIIDRASGAVRRVLDGHPLTQADPSIVPMINGKPYKSAHGKVATLHLSHLEISGDGRWMYFCPLFGPRLQRLPMESLRDSAKSDADLAREIEFVCDIPPVAGIHAIGETDFLLCAATDGAILHLHSDGQMSTLLKHEHICFPNEGSFSSDGKCFYFPNSGAHLIGRPFEIMRFHLSRH